MQSLNKSELFIQVMEAHKGILYKIAHSYCPHAEDRKDLVQEIMIQLWRSFDQYDSQYKYSTWIYRIALNVSISFYRKGTRKQYLVNPITDNLLQLAEGKNDSEKEEQLVQLQKFIQALNELDRALMLLYLEEKSYKEIADILGITETNVATKINRIKHHLKQKFTNTAN
jgi:RNA polymerase sigma factor (sigma-70 family)